jgi:site-specific recombinase XerD
VWNAPVARRHAEVFGHQVVTVVGKGRKERVVPVGATALRYLEGHLLALRPALVRDPACRALFLDTAGRRLPYHTLRRIVLRAGADAGLGEPLTMVAGPSATAYATPTRAGYGGPTL